MKVTYSTNKFICLCEFGERLIAKDAGFAWDPIIKKWYTTSSQIAARLRQYCDDVAIIKISQTLPITKPWSGRLSYPENETPYDFQKEAAMFALSRRNSYVALEAGLGKTIVATIIHNTVNQPALYISPPFLVKNTAHEFKRWGAKHAIIAHSHQTSPKPMATSVTIFPDSMLHRPMTIAALKDFIMRCKAQGFKPTLFIDEAQRFKNLTAKRTKALLPLVKHFSKVVFLSGTPIPNRPVEIYSILKAAAPEVIDNMNYYEFGMKYCAGYRNQYGWDFSGASNVDDLSKRVIGPFMLRVKKADVLKELPPKTEEMVFINESLSANIKKMDLAILRAYFPEDLIGKQIAQNLKLTDGEELNLATYRKELGTLKAKATAAFVKSILEDSEESILIFALHRAAISELEKELGDYRPLVITGAVPVDKRQEIVQTFQMDPSRRVFIGNIQAAGVGFTLTKATRVIFAEFSWVSGENDQASDRAHRIGQKDHVFVQYMVFEDSVDKAVLQTIFAKRKVIEQFDGVRA